MSKREHARYIGHWRWSDSAPLLFAAIKEGKEEEEASLISPYSVKVLLYSTCNHLQAVLLYTVSRYLQTYRTIRMYSFFGCWDEYISHWCVHTCVVNGEKCSVCTPVIFGGSVLVEYSTVYCVYSYSTVHILSFAGACSSLYAYISFSRFSTLLLHRVTLPSLPDSFLLCCTLFLTILVLSVVVWRSGSLLSPLKPRPLIKFYPHSPTVVVLCRT